MRLAIICLVGAAVFVFPCAWDSDPHAIAPAASIIARISTASVPVGLHVSQDTFSTEVSTAKEY
ncbi:hypothetical protein [Mesorhizobium sp. A623]